MTAARVFDLGTPVALACGAAIAMTGDHVRRRGDCPVICARNGGSRPAHWVAESIRRRARRRGSS